MIFTALFFVIGFLAEFVGRILPNWTIYPDEILEAVNYFGSCLDLFDLTGTGFFKSFVAMLLLLLQFEVYYFTAKKIISFVNWARGTGRGLEI